MALSHVSTEHGCTMDIPECTIQLHITRWFDALQVNVSNGELFSDLRVIAVCNSYMYYQYIQIYRDAAFN